MFYQAFDFQQWCVHSIFEFSVFFEFIFLQRRFPTGRLMTLMQSQERRIRFPAFVDRKRTARLEAAAGAAGVK
jgi:hypothetical protein